MGQHKGHPGPVKPEEEKLNQWVRVGFTKKEMPLIKSRAKGLGISVAKYFRTLFVADITKNA